MSTPLPSSSSSSTLPPAPPPTSSPQHPKSYPCLPPPFPPRLFFCVDATTGAVSLPPLPAPSPPPDADYLSIRHLQNMSYASSVLFPPSPSPLPPDLSQVLDCKSLLPFSPCLSRITSHRDNPHDDNMFDDPQFGLCAELCLKAGALLAEAGRLEEGEGEELERAREYWREGKAKAESVA